MRVASLATEGAKSSVLAWRLRVARATPVAQLAASITRLAWLYAAPPGLVRRGCSRRGGAPRRPAGLHVRAASLWAVPLGLVRRPCCCAYACDGGAT
jgi:hypothetical protein